MSSQSTSRTPTGSTGQAPGQHATDGVAEDTGPDHDGDPGELHPRDERAGSVDGVATDDTGPGSDPDGDAGEVSTSA